MTEFNIFSNDSRSVSPTNNQDRFISGTSANNENDNHSHSSSKPRGCQDFEFVGFVKEKLLGTLKKYPDTWALTPVKKDKRPYRKDWQKQGCDRKAIARDIQSGKANGVGLITGELSGGILAIDVDGASAGKLLEAIFPQGLGETFSWSSGKPGRCQLLFQLGDKARAVARDFTRKAFKEWGNVQTEAGEQLEFRYNQMQSVLPPSAHPETGRYRNSNGVAVSHSDKIDTFVIELIQGHTPDLQPIRAEEKEEPEPLQPPRKRALTPAPATRPNLTRFDAVPLEACISVEHRSVLQNGVSQGGRNNTGAALARDLIGTASYLNSIGQSYDGDPQALLYEFGRRCSPSIGDRELEQIWRSAERDNPSPCLSEDKIDKCIAACHRKDGRQIAPASASSSKNSSKPKSDNNHLDIAQFCDYVVAEDFHGTELETTILDYSRHFGVHVEALRKTIAQARAESERRETSEETRESVDTILAASSSSLNLSEVLPPKLAEPIERLARNMSLRPELYLTALLAVVSGLSKAGSCLTVWESTDFQITPGLNLGIVAESAQKKTPPGKAVIVKPLRALNKEAKQQYEKEFKEYEIQNAAWESAKGDARQEKFPDGKPQKPVPRFFRITDATNEWIQKQFSQCSQGMIYHTDELARLFKSLNAYRNGKGGDEEALLEYWSGQGPVSMRVGDNPRITEDVNLSIYGTIQPDVLAKFLGDCSDSNGKFARFDWVVQPLSAAVLTEDIGKLNLTEMLAGIYKPIADLPVFELNPSEEAKRLFRDAHNRIEQKRVKDPHQGMRAYWGKLPTKIGKYAIALHLIKQIFEGKDPLALVDADTMHAAIKVAHFYMQQTRSLYGQFGGEGDGLAPDLAKILAKCRSLEGEYVPARTIKSYLYNRNSDVDATKIRAWFSELASLGYGETSGKGKRLRFKAKLLTLMSTVDIDVNSPKLIETNGFKNNVDIVDTSSLSTSPPISPQTELDKREEIFQNTPVLVNNVNILAESQSQQAFEGADIASANGQQCVNTFDRQPKTDDSGVLEKGADISQADPQPPDPPVDELPDAIEAAEPEIEKQQTWVVLLEEIPLEESETLIDGWRMCMDDCDPTTQQAVLDALPENVRAVLQNVEPTVEMSPEKQQDTFKPGLCVHVQDRKGKWRNATIVEVKGDSYRVDFGGESVAWVPGTVIRLAPADGGSTT